MNGEWMENSELMDGWMNECMVRCYTLWLAKSNRCCVTFFLCKSMYSSLTQSVVKGAPLVINCFTTSACPLRDASSNLLPRSTSESFSFSFMVNDTSLLKTKQN